MLCRQTVHFPPNDNTPHPVHHTRPPVRVREEEGRDGVEREAGCPLALHELGQGPLCESVNKCMYRCCERTENPPVCMYPYVCMYKCCEGTENPLVCICA